ncbi:MAG: F-box protein [Kistimonas sp.]|nr:F-box protein [Kistimonas sp.]
MHVKGANKGPGVSLSPGPVAAAGVPSPGWRQAVVVTEGVNTPGARAPAGPLVAALAPSHWPELVLERVFRQLKIGDLLACSRVCHSWHRLAYEHRVQVHCLSQTYTASHRRQMERALDSDRVRAGLEPWCSRLASAAPGNSQPPASGRASPRELLRTVMRLMLLTGHFYPQIMSGIDWFGATVQELLCSPDGEWFAVSRLLSGQQRSLVSILGHYVRSPENLMLIQSAGDMGAVVCCLTFSSDSRSLRSIYRTGQMETWQSLRQDAWHIYRHLGDIAGTAQLVLKVVLSPDGRQLAAVTHNSLLIYGEGEHQGWGAPQWNRVWAEGQVQFALADPDQLAMQFSPDNHHFVFAYGHAVFVCTREGDSWQAQSLDTLRAPVRGQPVFHPGSRLFALASGPDSRDGGSVVVHIQFWQFEQAQGWGEVRQHGGIVSAGLYARVHPVTGYKVPVAFSPDGEVMVGPDLLSCQDVFVVPCHGPGAWSMGESLPCGALCGDRGSYGTLHGVQWSASSSFLAVSTDADVCLWQREPSWRLVFRSETGRPGVAIPFVFSPDGYHCALAAGPDLRDVALCGPAGAGGYACKRQVSFILDWQDLRVEKLLFTPDATRLMVVLSGSRVQADMSDGTGRRGDFRRGNRLVFLDMVPRMRGLTADPNQPEPAQQQD